MLRNVGQILLLVGIVLQVEELRSLTHGEKMSVGKWAAELKAKNDRAAKKGEASDIDGAAEITFKIVQLCVMEADGETPFLQNDKSAREAWASLSGEFTEPLSKAAAEFAGLAAPTKGEQDEAQVSAGNESEAT